MVHTIGGSLQNTDGSTWSNFIANLLGLSHDEATFSRRGFSSKEEGRRLALERVGRSFIDGYNSALRCRSGVEIFESSYSVDLDIRGFFLEGAGMGAAIRGSLPSQPERKKCLSALLDSDYIYLVHVGVGWSFSRLPWRRKALLRQLDPTLKWLAFDGCGFSDTYFQFNKVFHGWKRFASGYEAHAYDQGIGRGLWFVFGAEPVEVVDAFRNFAPERHQDLWSGLGLAISYAGPNREEDLLQLLMLSGKHKAALAQGVAFACEARERVDHVPEHTNRAATCITGCSSSDLARLVRNCRLRSELRIVDSEMHYESWRQGVMTELRGNKQ